MYPKRRFIVFGGEEAPLAITVRMPNIENPFGVGAFVGTIWLSN